MSNFFWSNDVPSQAFYYYHYCLKPLDPKPPTYHASLAEPPVGTHKVPLICGHVHTLKIQEGRLIYPGCPVLLQYVNRAEPPETPSPEKRVWGIGWFAAKDGSEVWREGWLDAALYDQNGQPQ